VDSGFGNSIYWTLPVVTTIIHFITLQHINERLLPSVWYDFRLLTKSVFLCHFFTLYVSVSPFLLVCNLPVTLLKQFFANSTANTLSNSWDVMQIIAFCYENNCLPSRYNGNTSLRCLGNDSSVPAFRHFVTIYTHTCMQVCDYVRQRHSVHLRTKQ
jgi:hypothetical protein